MGGDAATGSVGTTCVSYETARPVMYVMKEEGMKEVDGEIVDEGGDEVADDGDDDDEPLVDEDGNGGDGALVDRTKASLAAGDFTTLSIRPTTLPFPRTASAESLSLLSTTDTIACLLVPASVPLGKGNANCRIAQVRIGILNVTSANGAGGALLPPLPPPPPLPSPSPSTGTSIPSSHAATVNEETRRRPLPLAETTP